jgi:hypothetical protein
MACRNDAAEDDFVSAPASGAAHSALFHPMPGDGRLGAAIRCTYSGDSSARDLDDVGLATGPRAAGILNSTPSWRRSRPRGLSMRGRSAASASDVACACAVASLVPALYVLRLLAPWCRRRIARTRFEPASPAAQASMLARCHSR